MADHRVGIGVLGRVVVGYDVMVGVCQRSEPRDDTPNGVKFAPEATLVMIFAVFQHFFA